MLETLSKKSDTQANSTVKLIESDIVFVFGERGCLCHPTDRYLLKI